MCFDVKWSGSYIDVEILLSVDVLVKKWGLALLDWITGKVLSKFYLGIAVTCFIIGLALLVVADGPFLLFATLFFLPAAFFGIFALLKLIVYCWKHFSQFNNSVMLGLPGGLILWVLADPSGMMSLFCDIDGVCWFTTSELCDSGSGAIFTALMYLSEVGKAAFFASLVWVIFEFNKDGNGKQSLTGGSNAKEK